MKKYTAICGLIVLVLALVLSGCATYSAFTSGGTAAEKKAAVCSDALRAYDLADYWIPRVAPGTDAATYWEDYKIGASVTMKALCGSAQ